MKIAVRLGSFLIAAAPVAFAVAVALTVRHGAALASARDQETLGLRNTLMQIDDMLTVSAGVAAVTGDLNWEGRYRRAGSEQASRLPDGRASAVLSERVRPPEAPTDENRRRDLADMENNVFGLIREGRLEEARGILFSREYETLKNAYAESVLWFTLANDELLQLNRIWGDVVHDRKMLATAAQMAAMTGDPKWEESHRDFTLRIYPALTELLQISSRLGCEKTVRALQISNFALLRMEDAAILRAKEGRKEGGARILSGPEYAAQEKIYTDAMASLAVRIATNAYPLVHYRIGYTVLYALSAACLLAGIFMTFLFLRRFRFKGLKNKLKPAARSPWTIANYS